MVDLGWPNLGDLNIFVKVKVQIHKLVIWVNIIIKHGLIKLTVLDKPATLDNNKVTKNLWRDNMMSPKLQILDLLLIFIDLICISKVLWQSVLSDLLNFKSLLQELLLLGYNIVDILLTVVRKNYSLLKVLDILGKIVNWAPNFNIGIKFFMKVWNYDHITVVVALGSDHSIFYHRFDLIIAVSILIDTKLRVDQVWLKKVYLVDWFEIINILVLLFLFIWPFNETVHKWGLFRLVYDIVNCKGFLLLVFE